MVFSKTLAAAVLIAAASAQVGPYDKGDLGVLSCPSTTRISGNTGSTFNIGQATGPGPDHWWRFSLDQQTIVTLDACGSWFDSAVGFYNRGVTEALASGVGNCANGVGGTVTATLEAGEYSMIVEGVAANDRGPYSGSLTCELPGGTPPPPPTPPPNPPPTPPPTPQSPTVATCNGGDPDPTSPCGTITAATRDTLCPRLAGVCPATCDRCPTEATTSPSAISSTSTATMTTPTLAIEIELADEFVEDDKAATVVSLWWIFVILVILLLCGCCTFWCWKQKQSNDRVISDLKKHKVTAHENPAYAPGAAAAAPRAAVFNQVYSIPMDDGGEALYMDPDNVAEEQYMGPDAPAVPTKTGGDAIVDTDAASFGLVNLAYDLQTAPTPDTASGDYDQVVAIVGTDGSMDALAPATTTAGPTASICIWDSGARKCRNVVVAGTTFCQSHTCESCPEGKSSSDPSCQKCAVYGIGPAQPNAPMPGTVLPQQAPPATVAGLAAAGPRRLAVNGVLGGEDAADAPGTYDAMTRC